MFDSHQHVIGFQASLDNEETSVCTFSIADALVCAALIDEYTLTFIDYQVLPKEELAEFDSPLRISVPTHSARYYVAPLFDTNIIIQ